MAAIRIQEAASHRLDEIYRFTRARWGKKQADSYIVGLFEAFAMIESRGVAHVQCRPHSAWTVITSGMNGISFTGAGCRTAISES